jgi:hypothetical protein
MIRVSKDAQRLLGALWAPEGEVMRLVPSPEADGGLAFRHGRGEGADQIVQRDGRQILRIDSSVRKHFDCSTMETVDGALGMVPPGPMPSDDGS